MTIHEQIEQRRKAVGHRRCAGFNTRGKPCGARAWWTLTETSPYCRNHEYVGPAPCVGSGPLDGVWMDRGLVGYNFQMDEVALGRAPDGGTRLLAMPSCNYAGSRVVVVGRYRFGYRETDLAPRWFWEGVSQKRTTEP